MEASKAVVTSILPYYGARGPLMQQHCNAEYGRIIKAIGDLQGDVVRYRALQILLLVAYVDRNGFSFLRVHPPLSVVAQRDQHHPPFGATQRYRLIAPDDRENYIDGFARAFFTDAQPFSLMVKVRSKQRPWRGAPQQGTGRSHSPSPLVHYHMLSRHPTATGRCGSTS